MNERTVQWVLLRDWDYLRRCLRLPLVRRFAENLGTEYGILDFVLQTTDPTANLAVVELETGVDSHGKLEFCIEQVTRYKQVTFPPHKVLHVILYAEDVTPDQLAQELQQKSAQIGVVLRTYQIAEVEQLYQKLLKDLAKNVGIPLGPTVAMDVCYLRWINTLVKPFVDKQAAELPVDVFYQDGRPSVFGSRTTYGVRKRLSQDFELITEKKVRGEKVLALTELGQRFADALAPDMLVGTAQTPPLSAEQRRILLESLTNGRILSCKANIYYFLRFVHITEGLWVPRSSTPEPSSSNDPAYRYWQLVTALLDKHYAWRTITDFLAFTCNQCEELGLVERLHGHHRHHQQVVLTSLGSRVLGLLELDLHLKRERIQIPLQVE